MRWAAAVLEVEDHHHQGGGLAVAQGGMSPPACLAHALAELAGALEAGAHGGALGQAGGVRGRFGLDRQLFEERLGRERFRRGWLDERPGGARRQVREPEADRGAPPQGLGAYALGPGVGERLAALGDTGPGADHLVDAHAVGPDPLRVAGLALHRGRVRAQVRAPNFALLEPAHRDLDVEAGACQVRVAQLLPGEAHLEDLLGTGLAVVERTQLLVELAVLVEAARSHQAVQVVVAMVAAGVGYMHGPRDRGVPVARQLRRPRLGERLALLVGQLVGQGHLDVASDARVLAPLGRLERVGEGLRVAGPPGRGVVAVGESRCGHSAPARVVVLDARALVDEREPQPIRDRGRHAVALAARVAADVEVADRHGALSARSAAGRDRREAPDISLRTEGPATRVPARANPSAARVCVSALLQRAERASLALFASLSWHLCCVMALEYPMQF